MSLLTEHQHDLLSTGVIAGYLPLFWQMWW